MSDLLFVYGTLRIGENNPTAKFFHQHSQFLGKGHFPGRLIQLGTYTGAIYEPGSASVVEGEIFQLLRKGLILGVLDEYEGIGDEFPQPNEYIRKMCPVIQADQEVICWVYLYNLA